MLFKTFLKVFVCFRNMRKKLVLSKKLELIKNEVLNHEEINKLWEYSNVVTVKRMAYSDHGKTHAEIVCERSLELYSFFENKLKEYPSIVDFGLGYEEGQVVVMLSSLFHDIGNSVNREEHPLFSVLLAGKYVDEILENHYDKKTVLALKTQIFDAIYVHEKKFAYSLESSVLKIGDALDMEKERARISSLFGSISIHTFSALAIDKVEIEQNEEKIHINVYTQHTAGIFQVEEHLIPRIKNTIIQGLFDIKVILPDREFLIDINSKPFSNLRKKSII